MLACMLFGKTITDCDKVDLRQKVLCLPFLTLKSLLTTIKLSF